MKHVWNVRPPYRPRHKQPDLALLQRQSRIYNEVRALAEAIGGFGNPKVEVGAAHFHQLQ